MAKKEKRFRKSSLETIKAASDVVKKYKGHGKLTLMQIFIFLVDSDKVAGSRSSYKRLQTLISDANKCGIFDKEDIAGRYHGMKLKKRRAK